MNAASPEQRKAYEFLLEKFRTQDPFTKAEFQAATGWNPRKATFRTYWKKQFEPLLVPIDATRYRVGEVFRRFVAWEKFQLHVTQNRRFSASAYTNFAHDTVMQFEFLCRSQMKLSLERLSMRFSIRTLLSPG